jgi:hypothetical protein
MVCSTLRNSIPKSIVYCQVREAKRSLLDHFFTELGAREVRLILSFKGFFGRLQKRVCFISCSELFDIPTWNAFDFEVQWNRIPNISAICSMQMKQLSKLLDEDPAVMERRTNLAKRLELYRSAQTEIDAVAWSK